MSNLATQDGTKTNIQVVAPPQPMPVKLLDDWRDKIETALNASKEEFENVTPIYWEARQDEEKTMVLQGFKLVNKKDDAGNITGQDFAVVFFDGSREVICNQIALKDAMKNKFQGTVFKIKCVMAVAKQAKRFEILELKDKE